MCGGDGSEHEISLLSAKFIEKQLNLTKDFNVIKVVIHNHQFMLDEKTSGYFDADGDFVFGDKKVKAPLPRWCYKAASHMSFYHTARKNKVRL